MENQANYIQERNEDENSVINLVYRYISHWRWFLLSVVVALVRAFLYLRYQTPKYEVAASILIKDDKKGAGLSELSAFEDLGLLPKSIR